MGVKVYFVYDGEGDAPIAGSRLGREAYKAKITLPDGWMSGPCEKLRSFFTSTYNKKFADKALVEDDLTLHVGPVALPMDGIVSNFVSEYNDILVRHKPPVSEVAAAPEGSLVCGNFGCGKRFLPDENNDGACEHHAKGPVFHDTFKYWGCCPDQRALDWEEFEKIPKCSKGAHVVSDRPVSFASAPVENTALSTDQLAAMQAQQAQAAPAGDDKPRTGPREFEEAVHAKQAPQQVVDGKAKCRNYACQQPFVVADNNDAACVHHTGGPVFHDTYKYWACCPDKKCIEFDDFVKVPGCATGPHKL